MTKREATRVLEALDLLGVALAEENHAWTPLERSRYEQAVKTLTNVGGERQHVTSEHCWCGPHTESYGEKVA